MNILAFGASASKHSINKTFAHYAADQFNGHHSEKVDLLDFPLPIYTIDHEKEIGFPKNAELFMEKIASADLIIISFAEHNGSYTAWFKNLFDWLTRINNKFLQDKKLLLLSTSPGARGGISVLTAAVDRFPRHGGEIVGSFSLPNFETNFDPQTNFMNESLKDQFKEVLRKSQ
jgi:chromate reductase, NAD(P)H dehydrogenase (quinone)